MSSGSRPEFVFRHFEMSKNKLVTLIWVYQMFRLVSSTFVYVTSFYFCLTEKGKRRRLKVNSRSNLQHHVSRRVEKKYVCNAL